jgi:transcription antitermination factor NusG
MQQIEYLSEEATTVSERTGLELTTPGVHQAPSESLLREQPTPIMSHDSPHGRATRTVQMPLEPLDAHRRANRLCSVSDLSWFVAHTRPRREKKLLQYCEREGLSASLPLYRATHKYPGKTVVFQKPLFPGYVFLQIAVDQRRKIHQSDHLAKLLEVADQDLFVRQLEDVLRALENDFELRIVPLIKEGMRVKINNGPLHGIEGWVEGRHGMNTVVLRLDFIGQAAALKMEATDVELI